MKADRQKADTQKADRQMHFTTPYLMAISIDVIDARCVESGRPSDDSMHFVALLEEQFC
jgi:hypothetical protein